MTPAPINLLLVLLLSGIHCATFGAILPKAIEIQHAHDPLIHAYHITDLLRGELDNTGERNVSDQINRALEAVFDMGGGTLYLPAGKYRLDDPIYVPAGTALRGDFQKPGHGPVDVRKNTVLCAYYGRDLDSQDPPLIFVDGSALIDGLVIWYPEQDSGNITPYAPTIRHGNRKGRWAINTVSRNLYLVNAYHGIHLGKQGVHTAIQSVKNVYGTALNSGITVWSDADTVRMVNINFKPNYWLSAKLGKSPLDTSALKEHLIKNATGIVYHRADSSELVNVRISGYHRGLALLEGIQEHQFAPGIWIDNEGHYTNFNITDCYYAVYIKSIKDHGTQFYNCNLEGIHSAVYIESPSRPDEVAMFMRCRLKGGVYSVSQNWENQKSDFFALMFSACMFESPINWTGGILSVVDCRFNFSGRHIYIGPEVNKAIITDSRFNGPRNIENEIGDNCIISDSTTAHVSPPAYNYDPDRGDAYRPSQNATEFVEATPETTDDTARIQSAIDRIHDSGGGYVVLLPGNYHLENRLLVRHGVELRGLLDSWMHPRFISYYWNQGAAKGSNIFVSYRGESIDDAAIVLGDGSGLEGLFFHYPGQQFDTDTKEVTETFCWLIQMYGDRSYVKHVTASNPWRFIDAETYHPDNIYIGFSSGAPLEQGLRIGEGENNMIDCVHFNSWFWNVADFPNKPSSGEQEEDYKLNLDNWMKANSSAFIFAGSRNVEMFAGFVFCSQRAFTLEPGKRSGKGPSGMIVSSGCDWTKYGLSVYANNGLTFASVHFIIVNKNDPDMDISSIYIDESCEDSISLFNVSTWGQAPRMLSMHGQPQSGISIYNMAYQLRRMNQMNLIKSGHADIVNVIRTEKRTPMFYDLGQDASVHLRAHSYAHGLSSEAKDDSAKPFIKREERRENGLFQSYSHF